MCINRNPALRHPLPPKPEMAQPDPPTFSQFPGLWERQIPQNATLRVYDSKRRNSYCREYEEYKRVVFNLQTMFPNSPTGQLEFDDWVDMRLAKIEDERKSLQLKISAAIAKTIRKGHGENFETGGFCPVKNLSAVDWKVDVPPKITKKFLLPAIDFNKEDRPGLASPFNSKKYCDQWTGIGSQVTEDGRRSPFVLNLSETYSKSSMMSPYHWEKCRNLWDEVGPCTDGSDQPAGVKCFVAESCDSRELISPSPSSSVPSSSEPPSTPSSPVESLLSTPTQSPRWSPEIKTTPDFNYELGYAAAEIQSLYGSYSPGASGCRTVLGLDFAHLDPELDSTELSDDDREYFHPNRHTAWVLV